MTSCPLAAAERLKRRDTLKETLKLTYNTDMRYDSRLCLNYINQMEKVLTIEQIANELKLMDHLYRSTPYSKMMGTLLTSHWRHCDPVKRDILSDQFSAYCKKLIAADNLEDFACCTPAHCTFKAECGSDALDQ